MELSIDNFISKTTDFWTDNLLDTILRSFDAYVSQLDMAALGFQGSEPHATGRPAYAPQDLLKL